MIGDDDFGNRRHTACVCAQSLEHTNFCRCFIFGTMAGAIHTFAQQYAEIFCSFAKYITHFMVICFTHIGEANAEFIFVQTDERATGHQHIDMIGNEHELTGIKSGVSSAGSIRNNHSGAAKAMKYTNGQRHAFEIAALIEMYAALHHDQIFAIQLSKDEITGMPMYTRSRKTFDICIRDDDLVIKCINKGTKARTQNHT